MPLSDPDKTHVRNFFEQLPKCLVDGRNEAVVSYLAVRRHEELVVIAARVVLGGKAVNDKLPSELETLNVRAGHFHMRELGLSVEDYLANVFDRGTLRVPGSAYLFPGNSLGMHGAWLSTLDDAGLHRMRRLTVLKVYGGPRNETANRAEFDWELKAARVPYGGLEDLAFEFGFGAVEGQSISLEVLAEHLVEVDESSCVQDATANLVLRPRVKLDKSEVALAARVVSQGAVVSREYLWSSDIKWMTDSNGQELGIAKLDVPKGAAVHCTAIYDQKAQHERVVVDQASYENPLRVAFESFDAELAGLRSRLESGGAKKNDARAAESSLA